MSARTRRAASWHSNEFLDCYRRDLELPALRDYAVKAGETAEATRVPAG